MKRDSLPRIQRGFTLIELLLFLVVLGSISFLAWPRIGSIQRADSLQRFRYRLAVLALHAWREAQLSGRDQHLVFEPDRSRAYWKGERISISFPGGYRPVGRAAWILPAQGYPSNLTLILAQGADTMNAECDFSAPRR